MKLTKCPSKFLLIDSSAHLGDVELGSLINSARVTLLENSQDLDKFENKLSSNIRIACEELAITGTEFQIYSVDDAALSTMLKVKLGADYFIKAVSLNITEAKFLDELITIYMNMQAINNAINRRVKAYQGTMEEFFSKRPYLTRYQEKLDSFRFGLEGLSNAMDSMICDDLRALLREAW